MKKLSYIFVLLTFILIGCNQEGSIKPNLEFEKVQKVVIESIEQPNTTLEQKSEIEAFVEGIKVEEWILANLPENLTISKTYSMFQSDTIQLGENSSDNKELEQIGTILTYKNSDYITLQMGVVKVNYKVPEDVADFLANN